MLISNMNIFYVMSCISPDRVSTLFVMVSAAGMKYLRKEGFVHRDVKPGNILRHIAENGK